MGPSMPPLFVFCNKYGAPEDAASMDSAFVRVSHAFAYFATFSFKPRIFSIGSMLGSWPAQLK